MPVLNSSTDNPVTQAHDRIYMILLVVALIAGFAFSLGSVGYLLGFNATTLVLIAISFSMMSVNIWHESKAVKPVNDQLQGTALAMVPIALRWFLQIPLFHEALAAFSGDTALQQLSYMAQVMGLWVLVAVSEEAFRAAMLNVADLFAKFRDQGVQDRYKIVFANTVWVGFHFLQRPLDIGIYGVYIVWLFVSGLVMTFAMREFGMGAATLIHLIINLTA
jgi:hypothetical protein